MVWIFAGQPMDTGLVRAFTRNRVCNYPQFILFKKEHGAPVDATTVAKVTVMLALADRPFRGVLKMQEPRLGSVERLELTDVRHLVATVDLQGIVACRTQKMVM